jgi:hypothetical protein
VSESDALIHLRGGVVVPVGAYLAMLAVEAAGHTVCADGGDLIVEPGNGLAANILDALRTYKHDCVRLAQYVPDDSHLYQGAARRAS